MVMVADIGFASTAPSRALALCGMLCVAGTECGYTAPGMGRTNTRRRAAGKRIVASCIDG
jgi:hypothetical protein